MKNIQPACKDNSLPSLKLQHIYTMRIAVIGAGTAGMCAAKHALAQGNMVTVFEQAKDVGGTWIYTENVGTDDYGLDVHSSMYKGLQ